MNKEVAKAIKKAINDWQTGNRNYTFETRGIRYCKPLPENREYVCVFYLRVEGFYTDSSLKKPIELDFTSQDFITKNLNVEHPENANSDAIHLNQILDDFTKDCYDKIKVELESYPNPYTSDFFYWK